MPRGDGDQEIRKHVEEELADVFGYLPRFSDVVGISFSEVLASKAGSNAMWYSIEHSQGNALKRPAQSDSEALRASTPVHFPDHCQQTRTQLPLLRP